MGRVTREIGPVGYMGCSKHQTTKAAVEKKQEDPDDVQKQLERELQRQRFNRFFEDCVPSFGVVWTGCFFGSFPPAVFCWAPSNVTSRVRLSAPL